MSVPSILDNKQESHRVSIPVEQRRPTFVSGRQSWTSFVSELVHIRYPTSSTNLKTDFQRFDGVYTFIRIIVYGQNLWGTILLTELTGNPSDTARKKSAYTTDISRIFNLIQILGKGTFLQRSTMSGQVRAKTR